MLGRIRNSGTIKYLWGLMWLYLLNISVDTADPNPDHITEDLSFNDQESIIEVLVEMVLGFEDAFKEHCDPDHEEHNAGKNVKIDFLVYEIQSVHQAATHPAEKSNRFPDYHARLTNGHKVIDSPPPKV